MKTQILLILTILTAFTVKAQVFVENFEVPPFTVGGNVAGTNNWLTTGTGSNPTIVASGPLSYSNYPGSGIGNTASFPANDGVVANAYYASNAVSIGGTPLTVPAAGGAFYAAFLIKIEGSSRTTHSDIFAFENSSGSAQRGRIMARGNGNGTKFNLAFSKASLSGVTNPYVTYNNNEALDPANIYLLVMKYEVVDGADNDVVTLYFNPDPTQNEAAQTAKLIATDPATDFAVGATVHISLRQRGVVANVGGIRVGFNWDDVVKQSLTLPKLSIPTVGTATSPTTTGFTANWSAVANASSYDVKVYQNTSLVKTTNFGGQSTNTGTITGLSPFASYTYKVIAKGNGVNYSDSEPSSASDVIQTLDAQATTHYMASGRYTGTPVSTVNIDFSTLGAADCTVSENIKEVLNVGYVKFETNLRGATAGIYSNSVVFLHKTVAGNPPAYMYLPTMSSGVGTITVDARTTSTTAVRNIDIEYSLNGGEWTVLPGKESISAPASADENPPAPLQFNLAGNVQLRLSISHPTSSTWVAIKSINVTHNSVSTNLEQFIKNVYISNNILDLGTMNAHVYFYNMAGQKIFEIKNASSRVNLPEERGIVKVVNNNHSVSLKKLF